MNTKISGKKTKTKNKNQTTNKTNKSQQSSWVNFPAQGCKVTLDHLAVPADSTAQDHTEDHAKYHDHGNADAHCADDVEFIVEDLFDGIRTGLYGEGFEYVLLGADV